MEEALKSSVWVISPEYSGWLHKKGFHWRKLWKKRWIAISGAELAYADKVLIYELKHKRRKEAIYSFFHFRNQLQGKLIKIQ